MGVLIWRLLSSIGKGLWIVLGAVIVYLVLNDVWKEVVLPAKQQYDSYKQQHSAADVAEKTDIGLLIKDVAEPLRNGMLEAVGSTRREAEATVLRLQNSSESAVRKEYAALEGDLANVKRQLIGASVPYQPSFQILDISDPSGAIKRETQNAVGSQLRLAQLQVKREILVSEVSLAKSLLSVLDYKKQCAEDLRKKQVLAPLVRRAADSLRAFSEQQNPTAAEVRQLREITSSVIQSTAQLRRLERSVLDCTQGNAAKDSRLQQELAAAMQRLREIDSEGAFDGSLSAAEAQMRKGVGAWSAGIKASLKSNWLGRLVVEPLSTAGWSLVAMILGWFCAPYLWRITKFVIAAWAQRKPFPPLSPKANGREHLVVTGVSLDIPLDEHHELIVRPGFVQSLPENCDERTQLVLSKRSWRASVSAHLDRLVSIRGRSNGVACLSAGDDGENYLASIELPAGAVISVQPAKVIGVLRPLDDELVFERTTRFFYIHSWLRRQWRYYLLHGPATLIVKGCRGVKAATVERGGSQQDILTLGFSANLEYGIEPTGYFWGYVRGEVPLLRARFRGGRGIFVYEERADFRKTRSVTASVLGSAPNISDIATKVVAG